MVRKFETFVAKKDGQDVTFKVYEPTVEAYKIAAKARNEGFLVALNAKAPLRSQINTLLRNRGEWDDARETQYNALTKQILEKERQLKIGGMRLSVAKSIALEMKQARAKMRELLMDRSVLDNMTAEGQADTTHFNALLVETLVYIDKDGKEQRYFKDLDEYTLFSASTIANIAAGKLAELIYGIGDSAEKSLPENQFLLKYKFVDDKLRLINNDGHLVDSEGRLIDKDGHYVDKDGKHVDKFGNLIDDSGEYIVESKPFLDDDDNPIIETKQEVAPVVEKSE